VENFTVDWSSLPESIYRTRVVPMQASTGCPHKCTFCNFVKDRRLFSVKPLDKLIGEIKAASKRGAHYISFVDDNFRLGKNDLNSVCRRFIDDDLRIKWMSFIRADTLKDVDFELLRQSGCMEMRLGLESSDSQILNNMNKKVDVYIASEVVKKLLAVGINCTCYFIIGFPGETRDTALNTLEFIKGLEHPELPGMLSWSLYPFMLAPMSPIFESEMRKKYNLEGYMFDWKHSTMTSQKAYELVSEFFLELENSGPIYRGDNLGILLNLTPKQRNDFVTIRHRLSKLALKNQLRETDIIREFSNILPI
jgi:anaerobic magnesium-protoporphyrin IX monomethyl ester cyclase